MNDNLDHLIDEALATYAQSTPLAGFEERILGRMALAEPAPPRHRAIWLLLAAAALALVIVSLRLQQRPATQPSPLAQQSSALHQRIDPVVGESSPSRVLIKATTTHRRHLRSKAPLPQLSVFPTPSPLTPEERRLVLLMQQDPAHTIAAFANLKKQREPLEIEALVIEPLASDSAQ